METKHYNAALCRQLCPVSSCRRLPARPDESTPSRRRNAIVCSMHTERTDKGLFEGKTLS
jgi:hypothetical protein